MKSLFEPMLSKYYLDFVYTYEITYVIDLAPLDILKIGFCFT